MVLKFVITMKGLILYWELFYETISVLTCPLILIFLDTYTLKPGINGSLYKNIFKNSFLTVSLAELADK